VHSGAFVKQTLVFWRLTGDLCEILVQAMDVLWSMRENAACTSRVLEGRNNNKNTTKLITIQDRKHG
jgi:hypothetical protein